MAKLSVKSLVGPCVNSVLGWEFTAGKLVLEDDEDKVRAAVASWPHKYALAEAGKNAPSARTEG